MSNHIDAFYRGPHQKEWIEFLSICLYPHIVVFLACIHSCFDLICFTRFMLTVQNKERPKSKKGQGVEIFRPEFSLEQLQWSSQSQYVCCWGKKWMSFLLWGKRNGDIKKNDLWMFLDHEFFPFKHGRSWNLVIVTDYAPSSVIL
ncbi:hypothetical protein F2P56_025321 [Juglans regia]|uniref:Uncharacterized protein n=1 Tax=Juglans regia TaxID=51240 RepID=A0A833TTW2_JUGRE|nr:hypothetical protein F2P56_025321 [Juglans regia]